MIHSTRVRTNVPKQVLLIGDYDAGDDGLRLGLVQFGFRIEEAVNTSSAIARLSDSQRQIDAVVVDLSTPGVYLPDVADQLRGIDPKLPIVFLSENTAEFLHDCGLLEVDGIVLQRPFYPSEVAGALYEVLGLPNPFSHRLRATSL